MKTKLAYILLLWPWFTAASFADEPPARNSWLSFWHWEVQGTIPAVLKEPGPGGTVRELQGQIVQEYGEVRLLPRAASAGVAAVGTVTAASGLAATGFLSSSLPFVSNSAHLALIPLTCAAATCVAYFGLTGYVPGVFGNTMGKRRLYFVTPDGKIRDLEFGKGESTLSTELLVSRGRQFRTLEGDEKPIEVRSLRVTLDADGKVKEVTPMVSDPEHTTAARPVRIGRIRALSSCQYTAMHAAFP